MSNRMDKAKKDLADGLAEVRETALTMEDETLIGAFEFHAKRLRKSADKIEKAVVTIGGAGTGRN